MENGDDHTLIFTVTDADKFKAFWNKVFLRTKEQIPKMTEEFGGYAYCSSNGDMSKERDRYEQALNYAEEHSGDCNVWANANDIANGIEVKPEDEI